MKKKIFYFNIIYCCNNFCFFCYSHNTNSNHVNHRAINLLNFKTYLSKNNICENDRVIINGGEPLLHPLFIDIINYLRNINCEVLIYTNGRLLNELNLPVLSKKFRFIVPIHGNEQIHDKITRIKGSYIETLRGMNFLLESSECLLDLKIIVNNELIHVGEAELNDILMSFRSIPYNNGVQITKMADTIVSKRNKCCPVSNQEASIYTNIIYNCFRDKKEINIKIYDTCVKSMSWLLSKKIEKYTNNIEVFFKDCTQERVIIPRKVDLCCMASCEYKEYCISAVNEYKTLSINGDKVQEDIE